MGEIAINRLSIVSNGTSRLFWIVCAVKNARPTLVTGVHEVTWRVAMMMRCAIIVKKDVIMMIIIIIK
jgi:hypothetical protein